MLKKLLSLVTSVTSFLPSSLAAKLNTGVEARLRHVDVICPLHGFPARIDWDLNDTASVASAEAKLEELRSLDPRRSLFLEKAPGELGKRLRKPNTEENMISMPDIYAG